MIEDNKSVFMPVFGPWEEKRAPGENPHMAKEKHANCTQKDSPNSENGDCHAS